MNSENKKGFYKWSKPTYCIEKDHWQYKKFIEFKKKNGFTPDECWTLYNNIAKFVLPRLKYFKEHTCGTPGCFINLNDEHDKKALEKKHKHWLKILDKMIWSFEQAAKEDIDDVPEKYLKKYKDEYKKAHEVYFDDIHEGLSLFSEYFFCLWW